MKAESFFNILRKDVEGKRVISFDCQKNLILPKLPDQSSYYLRQLYLYNFTVYEGLSTDSQTKCNTFCYTWLEREYAKGSCQIASARLSPFWNWFGRCSHRKTNVWRFWRTKQDKHYGRDVGHMVGEKRCYRCNSSRWAGLQYKFCSREANL